MQNTGEPMPNVFLVLDLVVFRPGIAVWTRVAGPKCSSATFFIVSSPTPTLCCLHEKRGSSVVSALASVARGPRFVPRSRRGQFSESEHAFQG